MRKGKLRILFHIDELSEGGAEKVLCNLVNNMDQEKFDTTVHTTYQCDASQFLKAGIRYKYVFQKKNRLSRILYRVQAMLGLFYTLHLKGDYDLEVAYLECGPTKVMSSSTNKKAVKLAWVHCDLEKKMQGSMDEFVSKTRKHYMNYDKVVCVSEDCRDVFRKYYGDIPESVVIHNIIDEVEILKKASLQPAVKLVRNESINLVTCGRLTSQKNYLMLLSCIKKLLEQGLRPNLWILGEGEERQILETYIAEQKLGDVVKLLGFQSNPFPILKEADLYVCSSLYEGYSTAVVEAMILGIPVLTTDCTGMKEILGESEYGMIVPNNEEGLVNGLSCLLNDSELISVYKRNAIERRREMTGRNAAKITESFFEALLASKRKGS